VFSAGNGDIPGGTVMVALLILAKRQTEPLRREFPATLLFLCLPEL